MGLADDLRQLSDDELADLLHLRPELSEPPPTTFADLAQRASAPYSIDRCARGLDRFSQQLIDALRFHGGTATVEQIRSLATEAPPEEVVRAGLAVLRRLALVVRVAVDDGLSAWRLPPPVARVLAIGRPFGLGEPLERALDRHAISDLRVIADNLGIVPVTGKVGLVRLVADHLRDSERVADVLRRVDPRAVERLQTAVDHQSLANVPGLGQRGRVPVDAAQLLSFGLLVPVDWDSAEVPREVALMLMGGHPLRAFETEAPSVRFTAGGALADVIEQHPALVVDQIGRLLHVWSEQPPTLLKSGGLSVRDLRSLAKELGVEVPLAARVVALASVAALVHIDPMSQQAVPNEQASVWQELSPADRWVDLVDSWRRAPEEMGRVADPDSPAPPLRFDTPPLPDAAWRRARVLRALDVVPPDNTVDVESLVQHVIWDGPSRWRDYDDNVTPERRVQRVLGDAAVLGLLRNGSLSAPGRAVLEDDLAALRQAVLQTLPDPVDTFTVQADLTAIAPGELRTDVSAELAVLADVESRGGATLLRFSETSLRRAMDRGRTSSTIIEFLERHARPVVPQPLRYLVEDVGRRHGQVRVGVALSYLRADDAALLAAVVNHRKLSKTGLRLISATVAVSTMEAGKLIKLVREAGFLPAPEDDGDSLGITLVDRAPSASRDHRLRYRAEADRAWRRGLGQADAATLRAPNVAGVVSRLRVRG